MTSNNNTTSNTHQTDSSSDVYTLLYSPGTCSLGAIVALEWSGLRYKLVRHNIFAPVKHENFLKATPIIQQSPFMLRPGNPKPLLESEAILAHIVRHAPHANIGPGEDVDDFNYIMAFLMSTFHPAWVSGWYMRANEADPHVHKVLREIAQRSVNKVVAQLEYLLKDREWLAGDHKTVADAYFAGLIRWNNIVHLIEDLPKQYPRVHQLFLKIEEDPAVKFAHAIEADPSTAVSTSGGYLGEVRIEDLVLQ